MPSFSQIAPPVPIAAPGTAASGRILLIATPTAPKVLQAAGLSKRDVSAWDLGARNNCDAAVSVSWDDFAFAMPGLMLMGQADATALLGYEAATSWYTMLVHAVQDYPILQAFIIAMKLSPWLTLAAPALPPVLSLVGIRVTGAAPNPAALTSQIQTPQVTLLTMASGHLKSLAYPIRTKRGQPGPVGVMVVVDCRTREVVNGNH